MKALLVVLEAGDSKLPIFAVMKLPKRETLEKTIGEDLWVTSDSDLLLLLLMLLELLVRVNTAA